MFFNRKVKATRSTVLTIFDRDLCIVAAITLVQANIFSYMEKLCCFCDIGSSFLRAFQKCSK
jgi:hypothetical protein